ncbi:MAG: hypothetical protein H7A47_17165 [Verrucomicrobiales bacterium]|nr:hypothetical protein [Verrucomicrobiales bacterium]
MNIVTHLQELDDLIIEHTKPPVTPMLRNKVAFCIEQAQARAADVERQEQTLTKQIETIERLMKENQDIVSQKQALELEIARRDSDDATGFSGGVSAYKEDWLARKRNRSIEG